MIKLEDLKPANGSKKKTKRLGRGNSSGHGATSRKVIKDRKQEVVVIIK
jgi:large subunit ribosomal protein L15